MKTKDLTLSHYNFSIAKRLLDVSISGMILLVFSPLFVFILILVLVTSGFPIFFLQKRVGRNGKIFKIIKFRTMIPNAERLQTKLKKLNETDGPAFKINNDPRFTKIGKILSKTGLDELPQFINVLVGDMSIVGPRPLPVLEAKKLTKNDRLREKIKPGITSLWVINGTHKLTFKKWMSLDKEYLVDANIFYDLNIILKTVLLISKFFVELFS